MNQRSIDVGYRGPAPTPEAAALIDQVRQRKEETIRRSWVKLADGLRRRAAGDGAAVEDVLAAADALALSPEAVADAAGALARDADLAPLASEDDQRLNEEAGTFANDGRAFDQETARLVARRKEERDKLEASRQARLGRIVAIHAARSERSDLRRRFVNLFSDH